MKQLINGGITKSFSNSTANYAPIVGGYDNDWQTDVNSAYQIIPYNGSINTLYVELATAPGTGKSIKFSIYKNGSEVVYVTISNSSTNGYSTSSTATVSAGDKICIKTTPTGTPTTSISNWGVVLEYSGDHSSILGGVYFPEIRSGYKYSYLSGEGGGNMTSTNGQLIAASGTLRNLYIESIALGTSNSLTVTVYKNGSSTSVEASVSGTSTTANSGTNNVSVSAGDYVYFKVTVSLGGTLPKELYFSSGLEFTPSNSGESLILGGSEDTFGNNELNQGFASGCEWSTSTAQLNLCTIMISDVTLKDLYIKSDASPGSGSSYSLTLEKNGSDTSLEATISGTDTTANDTTNEISFSNYDNVRVKAGMDSVGLPPPGSVFHWGMVSYWEETSTEKNIIRMII